jgi:hypothetical protein
LSNPKAARISRTSIEQLSPRDTMARRLRILGASDDEMEAFLDSWDRLDDEWTAESRREFTHLSDAALREALAKVRAEYPFEEERRGELLDANPNSVAVGVISDSVDVEISGVQLPAGAPPIGSSIAVLDAWVDDNPERAVMVADAEVLDAQLRGQTPRKTLLAKMNAVVDG